MTRLYRKILLLVFAGSVLGVPAGLAAARLIFESGGDIQQRMAVIAADQLGSDVEARRKSLMIWSRALGAPMRIVDIDGTISTGDNAYQTAFITRISLRDGATLEVGEISFPRPPMWIFAGTVILVALSVALAIYPIVRRVTRNLEELRTSVVSLSDGDLGARVQVSGTDEVSELARSFNRAAERIEQLLAAHRSLLANASHELRSPLARIRMATELLADRYQLDANAGSLKEIRTSISELDELIDEILTASTLQARGAQNPPQELALDHIAAEEAKRVAATFAPTSLNLIGHPVLLRRLIRNLLENAVKYGEGQPITVTLSAQLNSAVLVVADQGSGIPEAERERIFEPFYRRRGGSESQGGVGLGLALARQIAELHGGSIRCESNAPRGARFVVVLPMMPLSNRPALNHA